MVKNLQIFETGKLYGNMNTNKAFYPENFSAEERAKDFLERRIILGNDKGFDGRKIFMADQCDKTGSYHILTEEDIEKAPNGWSDISQDILIITNKVPGIVAAHPVADCPVIIVSDSANKIAALCHCSAELIDKKMPMATVDALFRAAKELNINLRDEELKAYISSCVGPNWTYDCYPKWAKDEKVWKKSITDENGIYKINIRRAVSMQLAERYIKHLCLDLHNTDTDSNYYSNYMSTIDKTKAGRNLVGAFYPDENYQKTKSK